VISSPRRDVLGAIHDTARVIDRALMRAPRTVRVLVLALTGLSMLMFSLPKVPRPFVDYQALPLVNRLSQPDTYGTDTIADAYEARVVLNDVRDMYTKRLVDQTPLEAATWSKEASAPYPPITLLALAGLLALGTWGGAGLYGSVLGVAIAFVGLSLWYCLQTRWYVFPALYLNFSYFSGRFVTVQDGSYLIMLLVLIVALILARQGRGAADLLVSVAVTMKLSPLFYLKELWRMPRGRAVACILIVLAGLALPILMWDNYLYIFRFNDELKGDLFSAIGAAALAAVFALVLWYVEVRRGWDWEDRIGWGVVPFALFLAFKMNVARHLLIVLLLPDKRGLRSVVAGAALLPPAVLPGVSINVSLSIATLLLALVMAVQLRAIGWATVRDDLRHPRALVRQMLVS
jgi:hypothetical protein